MERQDKRHNLASPVRDALSLSNSFRYGIINLEKKVSHSEEEPYYRGQSRSYYCKVQVDTARCVCELEENRMGGWGGSWVLAVFHFLSTAPCLVHASMSSNKVLKGRSAWTLSLSLRNALHYLYLSSSAL